MSRLRENISSTRVLISGCALVSLSISSSSSVQMEFRHNLAYHLMLVVLLLLCSHDPHSVSFVDVKSLSSSHGSAEFSPILQLHHCLPKVLIAGIQRHLGGCLVGLMSEPVVRPSDYRI